MTRKSRGLEEPQDYPTSRGELGSCELATQTHSVFAAYGILEFTAPSCLKQETGSHSPLPLKMRPYINNSAQLLIGDTTIVVTRKTTSVAMEKI